eukprot:57004_1
MNKPVIKVTRRKHSKPKVDANADEKNNSNAIMAPIQENQAIETTIYASGAILNESVDINEKAKIPSVRKRRAKSHDIDLLSNDINKSIYKNKQEHIQCYASGAISTKLNETSKPKVLQNRRAKSHISNVMQNNYDYDSIWHVKQTQNVSFNFHIDAVMNKPKIV